MEAAYAGGQGEVMPGGGPLLCGKGCFLPPAVEASPAERQASVCPLR